MRLSNRTIPAGRDLLLGVAFLWTAIVAGCGGAQSVRVKDLPHHLAQPVTVKGRTGQILEGSPFRAFTLRDDYGDVVVVQIPSHLNYPIMGATYYVAGIPKRADGKILLSEATYRRWYGWLTLPAAIAAALLIVALSVLYFLSRQQTLHRAEAIREEVFAPPWGFVEVVAGPMDSGKRFALRYDEVLVGREVDATTGVLLADNAVSRQHGRIRRERDGRIVYEDLGSTNGSWVNEDPVPANQPVHLPEGALIRLGPETILRVAPAGQTFLAGPQPTSAPPGDERPTRP